MFSKMTRSKVFFFFLFVLEAKSPGHETITLNYLDLDAVLYALSPTMSRSEKEIFITPCKPFAVLFNLGSVSLPL